MDKVIVEKLLALNRTFYTDFADSFAASRTLSDPALTSILPYIPEGARVLDVGCGNGRLVSLLDRERPGASYVGIDAAPALIQVARERVSDLQHVTTQFHLLDVAQPDWPLLIDTLLIDTVVCLAVLHHIPSAELRQRIVQQMADRLVPGGVLLLSTWQFLNSPRLRRKIVDWAAVGISPQALETGDYLLDWKRGGRGLRYCCFIDEAQVARLAEESDLRVKETFRAGGRAGNLSLFAVLTRNGQTSVSKGEVSA